MAAEESFGVLLRRYRRLAGFSQEELAAKSFVSVRAISDLERGVNATPRLHTATALADGLALEGAERRAFERHARPWDDESAPTGQARVEGLAVPAQGRPPHTVDSFIDDGSRVEAVLALLGDRTNRVVSLIGPGGVGKTRLALEVIARLDGPVAYVALASLDDPTLMAGAIGHAIGVDHGPTRTHLQSLLDHVGTHRLTLVLDNLEQLADAVGDIAMLVRFCPGVSVLTTTRVPLRIAGEVRFTVGPLATTGNRPAARPDVQLFVARAALSGSGDDVDRLDDVAELCARLDGVPLAIELAAARSAIIPPAEVLRHLDDVLDILGEGRFDAPEQQRSMRAALDWSVRLLPPPVQDAFAALAVYAGAASADAAMAAWGMSESSVAAYFDLLQVLTDSHLVRLETDGADAAPRISMFETTRQFARELLEASGRADQVRERVSEWAVGLVERAEPALAGPDQLAWLDLLDQELPNLRAVGRHAAEQASDELIGASLRIAAGLQRFWDYRSRWFEGAAWLREALDRPGGTDAVRAKAYKALGVMHRCVGELDLAAAAQERGVELFRAAGDELGAASCLNNLGVVLIDRCEYQRAGEFLRDSLAICDAHDAWLLSGTVLNNLAVVAIEARELRSAFALCRRARHLLDEVGDIAARCWPDDNLARVLNLAGHPHWAVPIHRETVRQRLAFGDEIGFMWSLEALASAWTRTGDIEVAGRALGFVAAHRLRIGVVAVPHLSSLSARRREALIARIGAARCNELWDEGASLDPAVVRGWFTD